MSFTPKQLAELSLNDRKEVRNFQRFLRFWPKHSKTMIGRQRWQQYLGLFVGPVKILMLLCLLNDGTPQTPIPDPRDTCQQHMMCVPGHQTDAE